MIKTGFRGERKRILTPSLSQGEEECGGGKAEEPPPSHILHSRETHTQLSLATFKGGTVTSLLFGKPPNPRRGTS